MSSSEAAIRRQLKYRAWECGVCGVSFFTLAEAELHFHLDFSRHPGRDKDIVERLDVRLEKEVRCQLQGKAPSSLSAPSEGPPVQHQQSSGFSQQTLAPQAPDILAQAQAQVPGHGQSHFQGQAQPTFQGQGQFQFPGQAPYHFPGKGQPPPNYPQMGYGWPQGYFPPTQQPAAWAVSGQELYGPLAPLVHGGSPMSMGQEPWGGATSTQSEALGQSPAWKQQSIQLRAQPPLASKRPHEAESVRDEAGAGAAKTAKTSKELSPDQTINSKPTGDNPTKLSKPSGEEPTAPVPLTPAFGRILCAICQEGVINKRAREMDHVKRNHLGAPPYACRKCRYRCATAYDGQKHAMTHGYEGSAWETSCNITPVDPVERVRQLRVAFPGREWLGVDSERGLLCTQCNRHFLDPLTHVSKDHSKTILLQCSCGGFESTRWSALECFKRHQRNSGCGGALVDLRLRHGEDLKSLTERLVQGYRRHLPFHSAIKAAPGEEKEEEPADPRPKTPAEQTGDGPPTAQAASQPAMEAPPGEPEKEAAEEANPRHQAIDGPAFEQAKEDPGKKEEAQATGSQRGTKGSAPEPEKEAAGEAEYDSTRLKPDPQAPEATQEEDSIVGESSESELDASASAGKARGDGRGVFLNTPEPGQGAEESFVSETSAEENEKDESAAGEESEELQDEDSGAESRSPRRGAEVEEEIEASAMVFHEDDAVDSSELLQEGEIDSDGESEFEASPDEQLEAKEEEPTEKTDQTQVDKLAKTQSAKSLQCRLCGVWLATEEASRDHVITDHKLLTTRLWEDLFTAQSLDVA